MPILQMHRLVVLSLDVDLLVAVALTKEQESIRMGSLNLIKKHMQKLITTVVVKMDLTAH